MLFRGVTLIIIELIKNRKKIKIKVSDNGFEVEGDEEKALKIAKELIEQKQEEKAQKVLSDLLSGNSTIMNIDENVVKFIKMFKMQCIYQ